MDREELDRLTAEWKATKIELDSLPNRLPLKALEVLPDLYQPRSRPEAHSGVTADWHVDILKRTLKQPKRDLDPITVMRVGDRNIVIDGHHRLEAYRSTKGRNDVPVTYFAGSPKAALVEASRENAKDRLQMGDYERRQRAWTLVREGIDLSKADLVAATGVADRTIGNMRARLKEYQEAGQEPPEHWMEVLNGLQEPNPNWENEKVEEYRQKFQKAFPGTLPRNHAQVLSKAIIAYSPNYAQWLARFLVNDLGIIGSFVKEYEQRMAAGENHEDYGF